MREEFHVKFKMKECIEVEDGGLHFGQVDFDPRTDRFLNLHLSGDA